MQKFYFDSVTIKKDGEDGIIDANMFQGNDFDCLEQKVFANIIKDSD